MAWDRPEGVGVSSCAPPNGAMRETQAQMAFYQQIASADPAVIVSALDIDASVARMRNITATIDEEKKRIADNLIDIESRYSTVDVSNGFLAASHVETFEAAGTIKWFDASKGYGFIIPDDGLPDILLHVTALRASATPTAFEGARIHAEIIRRPKGLQVFRILSMDNSTVIHPSSLPLRTPCPAVADSEWVLATVMWFNRVRRFGFLKIANGQSAFVHMETLRRFGIADVQAGRAYEIRYGTGSKGPTVAEIRPLPAPRGWPYKL